jgi:hypothetical protein
MMIIPCPLPFVLQFGELPEQAAFGEEFCKSMSFFTRHSLTGGTTSLKVRISLSTPSTTPVVNPYGMHDVTKSCPPRLDISCCAADHHVLAMLAGQAA